MKKFKVLIEMEVVDVDTVTIDDIKESFFFKNVSPGKVLHSGRHGEKATVKQFHIEEIKEK